MTMKNLQGNKIYILQIRDRPRSAHAPPPLLKLGLAVSTIFFPPLDSPVLLYLLTCCTLFPFHVLCSYFYVSLPPEFGGRFQCLNS